MTNKERLMLALRGELPDCLPWAPRMELWYNPAKADGRLPDEYRGWTLPEIQRDLGMARHVFEPAFIFGELPSPAAQGLGLYEVRWPHRVQVENVETRTMRDGRNIHVEYFTPRGQLTATFVEDPQRKKAGSLPWCKEYVFKRVEDYEPLVYIFENIRCVPNPDSYQELVEEIGGEGVPIMPAGFVSPMHHALMNLMGHQQGFLELYDHPSQMRRLAEAIDSYLLQAQSISLDCPAEVIVGGFNYDRNMTPPPFFREHILPYLQRFSEALHSRGKLLMSHTDGECDGLLDLILDAGIDIAEAFTPPPLTRCSVASARKVWKDRLTIWGGIPSVALCPDSMGEDEFQCLVWDLFREIAPGDHFVLGVGDNVPTDADFARIRWISDMVQRHGRIPLAV